MEQGNILTLKQVDTLIDNTSKLGAEYDKKNIALLFKIMYHGMLTVSEVVGLTAMDIDYQKKEIKVRAKGGKPTTATFSSPSLWKEIVTHIKDLQPNQKLFPISRQMVWWHAKKLGELSEIKMSHLTKVSSNVYNNVIRYSRKYHLDNSGLFKESELDQLSRNFNALRGRGFGEYPYSMDSLKRKEEEANKILLTYCESCNYKNPDIAIFCCLCSKSLSEGKSIIK